VQIPIEIETQDKKLAFDLASEDNRLKTGQMIQVPGNVMLEYSGSIVRRSFGIPEVLTLVAHVAGTVEVGLFTAWLWSKLENKEVEKITIRRRVVTEITEEGIRQVVEEEFKCQK
jgi:hypothetical protein